MQASCPKRRNFVRMETTHGMEYKITPHRGLGSGLSELWRYRELFFYFTWRNIKVKYKQTALGFAWAVLQPLLMMLVFVVFFSRLLNVPTNGIPAPVFYYSGLLLWNMFSAGLSGAAQGMVENANIIKKVYFPRLIIPMSAILGAAFDFLMGLLVFGALLTYYGLSDTNLAIQPTLFIFLPMGILLVFIAALGAGVFLSALNVKYRDVRYAIPFFIQFLMFVSPVIYPASIVGDAVWAKRLLALNPLTGALHLGRAAFADTAVDWGLVAWGFLSGMLLLIFGLWYFRRMEAYFADIA